MTVANLKTKQIYPGDGVRRVWEIPFPFIRAEHIRLWRVDERGRAVEKTAGFTVDETEKEVTYPVEDSLELPLQAGEYLVLERQTPLTQETDLKRQAALDAQGLEDALDANVLRAQELAEGLSRALKFPVQTQGNETDAAAYITQLTDVQASALSACGQAEQSAQQAADNAALCAQTAQESARLAVDAKAQVAQFQPQIESAKNAALQAQTASESAQAACDESRRQCVSAQQVCAAAQADVAASAQSVSTQAAQVQTLAAQSATAAERAQNWASKTDGPVEGDVYSAKNTRKRPPKAHKISVAFLSGWWYSASLIWQRIIPAVCHFGRANTTPTPPRCTPIFTRGSKATLNCARPRPNMTLPLLLMGSARIMWRTRCPARCAFPNWPTISKWQIAQKALLKKVRGCRILLVV